MEEAVLSLLRDMGMSKYEARALYTLLRLREADAKTIAENADIPRTKIYEILEEFVRRGYVIELDTRPRRYKVPDPKKVLQMLIREEKERVARLEKRIEKVGEIIPLLSEPGKIRGNYIIRFRSPEDLITMLEDEVKDYGIAGYTPKTADIMEKLECKRIKSPFDFILTKNALYVPLAPLGEPSREVTVVVFQNRSIIDIFKGWLNERGDI